MIDMMTQIKSAKKSLTIEELLDRSVKELGKALPKHMSAQRLTRIALTALRLNPKLADNPRSFLAAVFQCAQVGLEPIDGAAWIIPYKDKVQFQIGYKGYVQLFWRHMRSVSLRMEKVHENDYFECDFARQENPIIHRPPKFGKDRGKVIGYYAIAFISGGGCILKTLTIQEALDHAKRFSKCWDRKNNKFLEGTPWATDFDSMAMKTVLIQLMKLLPKSIEIQRAIAMDGTVKSQLAIDMTEIPNEESFVEASENASESEFAPESVIKAMAESSSTDAENRESNLASEENLMTKVPMRDILESELDEVVLTRDKSKIAEWIAKRNADIKMLSAQERQAFRKSYEKAIKLADELSKKEMKSDV